MVQRVAQLFGVVFLLIGVLGFVASGMSMDASMETAPRLLGLFPVNALHNVVHLLFGVWALAAARSVAGAAQFARIGGGIYIVLALLGFVAPTTFGLIPIGSHDIWLHALIGVVLLVVGMQAGKTAATT
jgi:hypothetical protein